MKRHCYNIILVLVYLTICSCATVLNSPTTPIDITTDRPAKIVIDNHIVAAGETHTVIKVPRQNASVDLTFKSDKLSKTITLNPKNSFTYWLNAYPTPMFWTGFLIDKKKSKRYTYPGRIYVNVSDSSTGYLHYDPRIRKGELSCNVSLPWVNSFFLKPDYEKSKTNTGFWGIAVGIDYYHSKHQFLNLTGSAVTDFFIPVPAAVDYRGLNQVMASSYISLSNNHKIRNFSVGYGISFSNNIWGLRKFGIDTVSLSAENTPRRRTNNALGFVFPFYYQFGHNFYGGIIYRPTIFRFSKTTPFAYEHLISIDFGWKIKLRR
ncbi:MAG: hypothetical protein Q8908_05735 [Bacteroidota bacterium]|nr:hypothetical protein [Bacteroidota bacterium]